MFAMDFMEYFICFMLIYHNKSDFMDLCILNHKLLF